MRIKKVVFHCLWIKTGIVTNKISISSTSNSLNYGWRLLESYWYQQEYHQQTTTKHCLRYLRMNCQNMWQFHLEFLIKTKTIRESAQHTDGWFYGKQSSKKRWSKHLTQNNSFTFKFVSMNCGKFVTHSSSNTDSKTRI